MSVAGLLVFVGQSARRLQRFILSVGYRERDATPIVTQSVGFGAVVARFMYVSMVRSVWSSQTQSIGTKYHRVFPYLVPTLSAKTKTPPRTYNTLRQHKERCAV